MSLFRDNDYAKIHLARRTNQIALHQYIPVPEIPESMLTENMIPETLCSSPLNSFVHFILGWRSSRKNFWNPIVGFYAVLSSHGFRDGMRVYRNWSCC